MNEFLKTNTLQFKVRFSEVGNYGIYHLPLDFLVTNHVVDHLKQIIKRVKKCIFLSFGLVRRLETTTSRLNIEQLPLPQALVENQNFVYEGLRGGFGE